MPDIFVSKEEEVKPATEILKSKKPKKVHNLTGHVHSPFSSFCYFPDNVAFETQDAEEKVVLLLRKHPITNVPWIFMAILMAFAPALLQIFPILSFLPERFQFVAVLGWYLITTAYVIENFLTWFFNVNIITDERIVDIDFHNIIYKEVTDAKIDKIQDVTYKMGGVIRTLFNYGDVHILTASEVPAFDFLGVPRPDQVSKIIQDLVVEEEQEKIEGRVR